MKKYTKLCINYLSNLLHLEEQSALFAILSALGFEMPISPRVNPLGKPGFTRAGFYALFWKSGENWEINILNVQNNCANL